MGFPPQEGNNPTQQYHQVPFSLETFFNHFSQLIFIFTFLFIRESRDTIGDPEQKLPDIVLLRYINPSTASGSEHRCRWKLSWQELFCQSHPFPRWPPLLFPLIPLTAFPYSFHIIFHPHNVGFFNSGKPLLFPGHHLIGVPFRSSCNTGSVILISLIRPLSSFTSRNLSGKTTHAGKKLRNLRLLNLYCRLRSTLDMNSSMASSAS